jgi:hypothetical protein
MSYSIKLSPAAIEDLQRIESQLPGASLFIQTQLHLLASHPAALSERPYFPYRLEGQIYHFDKDFRPGWRSFFRVFFHYGADESHLLIDGITCQTVDWWWGKDSSAGLFAKGVQALCYRHRFTSRPRFHFSSDDSLHYGISDGAR